MKKVALTVAICLMFLGSWSWSDESLPSVLRIPAVELRQEGNVPAQARSQDQYVLTVNQSDAPAVIRMNFGLKDVSYQQTPSALLQIKQLMSLPQKNRGKALGALHVYVRASDGRGARLAGSMVVRPAGVPFDYSIDITNAVNEILKKPRKPERLECELRLEGAPTFATIYTLPANPDDSPLTLEIVPPAGWTCDWQDRMAPIAQGTRVYRESRLPLTAEKDAEVPLRLLYPVKKVIDVICCASGRKLQAGQDWILRDGRLYLPPGSGAPIQQESTFFTFERTDKEGNVRTVTNTIRLEEGTWYHERQIEVTYEPASRDNFFPPPLSTLDDLPRLKHKLLSKEPVCIVLFGDSISYGGNASRLTGIWPYQPSYGELAAWAVEQHYGSPVTFMNHSRGGATSTYALEQAASLVGTFKPDLAIVAFGMNDRAPARKEVFLDNMKTSLETIRAMSPDTEFLLIAPMMNNPKQPIGSEPIFAIRDKIVTLAGPGKAIVDMTTTHREILRRKDYLDLSGNGANHPNDFLHRIYAQRVCEVLIP